MTQKNKTSFLPLITALLFGLAAILIIFVFVSLQSETDTTTPTVSVQNATPTVSNVIISTSTFGSSASSINLTESSTTSVFVYGDITDNNGCIDVATSGSAKIYLYRSGNELFCLSEFPNNRYCYILDSTSPKCTFGTNDSCDGGTDTTVDFECELELHHFADATGSGSSFEAENWIGYLQATDAASAEGFSSTTAEVEVLTAINVGASIDYGTVALNASSSDVGLSVRNTGNEEVDVNISGTSMPCTLVGIIDVGQQAYATGSVIYANKTTLTGSSTLFQLNLAQETTTSTQSSSTINWQIELPESGLAGSCSGTTTITAIQST